MSETPGFRYSPSGREPVRPSAQRTQAVALGRERAFPPPENPDQVLLLERKRHLQRWIERLPPVRLRVLDVGGRIQPYRLLIEDRVEQYVGLDPQLEGLVDVVAVGEALPFRDESFDFVICTQVLSYAAQPFAMVTEMRRVLKPGGALFLTTPAFFPEHHDECWRFLPGGIRMLLAGWRHVEIAPEGNSMVGALRTVAVWMNARGAGGRVSSALTRRGIRILNRMGTRLKDNAGSTWMTANYSVWAEK